MSTLRAPYERLYHRLGAILDREETLLEHRQDPPALNHTHSVVMARSKWRAKGRDLEPIIARKEVWIWLSVVLSCCGLLAAALWPQFELSRLCVLLVLIAAGAPMGWGVISINIDVQSDLSNLKREIEAL